MTLIINGKESEVLDKSSIDDIIQELKIKDNVMAVAVNSQVVKQVNWSSYQPVEQDKIEFLNFVGGG